MYHSTCESCEQLTATASNFDRPLRVVTHDPHSSPSASAPLRARPPLYAAEDSRSSARRRRGGSAGLRSSPTSPWTTRSSPPPRFRRCRTVLTLLCAYWPTIQAPERAAEDLLDVHARQSDDHGGALAALMPHAPPDATPSRCCTARVLRRRRTVSHPGDRGPTLSLGGSSRTGGHLPYSAPGGSRIKPFTLPPLVLVHEHGA